MGASSPAASQLHQVFNRSSMSNAAVFQLQQFLTHKRRPEQRLSTPRGRRVQEARSWSGTGTTSNRAGGDKAAEADLDCSADRGSAGGGAAAPVDLGASLVDAADDGYPSDGSDGDLDVSLASLRCR